MHKSLSILGIIFLLVAGPVAAQTADTATDDTTTETDTNTETEETPTEDNPVSESTGLALGTPEGPQVGDTYVREEFTDWQLRCVKQAEGQDPCQLYQLLKDAAGNSVAEVNFFALPEGQQAVAGATLITPLETLLTQQVRLQIDDGEAKRYPFSFCAQVGCISRLGFTADELNEFRRGATGKVTIVPAAAPNQTVELTMSLSGFTAGYNAVVASEAAQ